MRVPWQEPTKCFLSRGTFELFRSIWQPRPNFFFVSRVHIWIHFSQQKVSVAEVIYLNGFVIYEVAAFCPEAFSLLAGPTKELIYCNKLFPLSLSLSLALFSIFFRTNFFNEWSFTLREFAHVIISLFWHNRERSEGERERERESA